ncbi:MAG TPA: hypothetical protein VFU42_02120 [Candidatus Deferrimicrobiaceae bacterium]|nr:hypothetical protein [Candidatus Deferrimicrobiaceae bacterium]
MRVDTAYDRTREPATDRGLREIVEGILTLAAAEKACLPVARIHSILHEMKTREPILSGLYFSLTGDVCYSDDVDKAIKNLVAWGSLENVGKSVVVAAGFHPFRKQLSNTWTKQQFQVVYAASLCFYDRLTGVPRDARREAS